MPEKIHYTLDGKIARITMDDGKANSITIGFLDEFKAALDRAGEEARGILIEGRERFFSAGLDLKKLGTYNQAEAEELMSKFITVCLFDLFCHPLPVVACVEGHAMAGGAVILLCCDKKIAAEGKYKIGINEVQVGINMPSFVLPMIRATLPPTSITDALLCGKVYDPEGALKDGFVDHLCPADETKGYALEAIRLMAGLPKQAFAATKTDLREQQIKELRTMSMEEMVKKTLTSGIFAGIHQG